MGAFDSYIYSSDTHYISNSGHDENSGYSGGTPGDQTGEEWALRTWYDRPWNCVLRYPDQNVAATLADLSCAAALNENIGYNQSNRTSYWTQLQACNYDPSSISTPCDDDCSAGVCSNIKAAGYLCGISALQGIEITSTYYMRSMLSGVGFQVLTSSQYTGSSSYLLPGDVLLNDNAHTACNVTLGSNAGSFSGVSSYGGSGAYVGGNGGYGAGLTADSIHYEYLKQYVVTVDRQTPNPDYASMKENNVNGVIIEAGYLYNDSHNEVDPRNPYLKDQVLNATAEDLSFGLYWEAKARTTAEVEREMYELSFIVRKYPPEMGLWFHTNFTSKKPKTNDKLVDEYYKWVVELGLKGRTGFYVTRDELEKITWDNYKDDWLLWLVDHVEDLDDVETLLSPCFFMLDQDKAAEVANNGFAVNSGSLISSGGLYITGDKTATYEAYPETTWDYITSTITGNKYGTAAIMGNMYQESNLIPATLEMQYQSSSGMSSQQYTEAVDNGTYTNFVNDAYGYGLVQWTWYTRKQGLIDYCQSQDASIGNLTAQLNYLNQELQSTFPDVYSYMRSATSVYDACHYFFVNFEGAGDSSESERQSRASSYYNAYASRSVSSTSSATSSSSDT